MANFMGVTSSNGIILDDNQKKQVDALMEKYHFNFMEDVQTATSDGKFGIWAHNWLDIRDKAEDQDSIEVFFEEFRHVLYKDQKLIVQSIGNTKCRFPLAAMQIVVTPGEVKITGFDLEEVTA